MTSEITTITTPFILNTRVNCYLISVDGGFIQVDTGLSGKRRMIEQALLDAGCQPGMLKLIVLTHGDRDHCGNAAYFREKFGAEIALHPDDAGMVERGDMFWNRKPPNAIMRFFGGFLGLGKADRFTPDLTVEDGYDFSAYGLDARAVHLPGHSSGSLGLLTAEGDLFCGDLLANQKSPDLWSIIDDPEAAAASVDKLKTFEIRTVYPGHGQPFPMAQFLAEH